MKLKPGLGDSYTIWPGNGVGLFYSYWTHTGRPYIAATEHISWAGNITEIPLQLWLNPGHHFRMAQW